MPEDMVYPYEDAETTLINMRNYPTDKVDVYVGDRTDSTSFEMSQFRNPFDKAEKGRDGAVIHYMVYFYRRYLSEDEFRKSVHGLQGETLGCWCYPRRCHGEVIADLLNKYAEDDLDGVLNMIEDNLDDVGEEDLGVEGFREYEGALDALDEAKDMIES